MPRFRARYYDAISCIYDRFVAAHSRDPQGRLREILADQAELKPGVRVLDLCTGTGAMLQPLSRRTGEGGLVVGLDFSHGMLSRAKEKTRSLQNVSLTTKACTSTIFAI